MGLHGSSEWWPRRIAICAIARSPLPEADALVPTIISSGGDDLETLIQGYAEARHTRAELRLAEIDKPANLPAATCPLLEITIRKRLNAD